MPADIALRVQAAQAFFPSECILWVDDPATRAVWPYWAGHEYIDYLAHMAPSQSSSPSAATADIARQLREMNRLDESTAELIRAHQAAAIELEELERSILTYRAHLEIDPEALHSMEERLSLLQSLQHKHHRDENGLLQLMEELKERLERLDRREEMLAEIDIRIASETKTLALLAEELTSSRTRTSWAR